jgi:hypothetical protein
MRIQNIGLITSFIIFLSACTAAQPEPTATVPLPADTPVPPTATFTFTPEPTPTSTPIPTNPPIPTPTKRIPPEDGVPLRQIGWNGSYQIWVNNLELDVTDDCRSYVCPGGSDQNHRYNGKWFFIGEGIGTQHFTFPGEFTDILITWGTYPIWEFDAIIADNGAGYGYTSEGLFCGQWADSGSIDLSEIIDYEYKQIPMASPWGILGPKPDGSYSVTKGQGFLLFRMFNLPWDELWDSYIPPNVLSTGDFVYSLSGITVYVND